jgi:hypothetical protein
MLINVARPFNAVLSVFFVAAMAAIAANDSVKSGSDRGHGVLRFAENPDLDHVARFPVVGGFGEASGDHDPVVILVKYEAVQREPPIASMRATMATIARNPSKQSGPWNLGGMRSFMI